MAFAIGTLLGTTEHILEEDWAVEAQLRAVTGDQWSELWVIAAAISELATPGEWGGGNVIDRTDDGHNVYEMPYMIYAQPVLRYEQLFYEMELVVPYERVLDQNRPVSQLDWIDSASISDVVRLNSAIIRGEHFGEGILGGAIEAGDIAAIVERLREWHTSKLAHGESATNEYATWMRSFRDGCRWQTAKSGPPHEYTIREWRPEARDDFERSVAGIREFGYSQTFYANTYIYFNLDGLKYWTMGDSLPHTSVLNRDPVEKRYV